MHAVTRLIRLGVVLLLWLLSTGCESRPEGAAADGSDPLTGASAAGYLFTHTEIGTSGEWSTTTASIEGVAVPEIEARGARLYGIWHPLGLEEDAPFGGLTDTELVLMMAWPEASPGEQPSIVDAAINALATVVSVRTRVFEPTVVPNGLDIPSGQGFYVHRANKYRAEDVDRAVQLSKEAWGTFEPTFGAQVTGLFRERPDHDGVAQMLRIVWYRSYEAWQESRQFGRDPESLRRFRERGQLELDGIGIATGLLVR